MESPLSFGHCRSLGPGTYYNEHVDLVRISVSPVDCIGAYNGTRDRYGPSETL